MDSNSLVKVLNGMRRPDGSPDIHMRESAIRELLDGPTLTFGELRLFKAHFDARMFRCNIIAMLPVEIVDIVLQYVGVDGYMAMCGVSRAWREKLSSEKVCSSILRLHFRTRWEREYVPLDDASKKAYLGQISSSLFSMCSKLLRRLAGKYHSFACYTLENRSIQRLAHAGIAEERRENFQYKNGRVAIEVADYSIVVNNLVTHVSISCIEEHRRKFGAWVLSDSYLVAFVDHRPRLTAWSLDQEADPISIYLESMVTIMGVSGNRVVFSQNPPAIKGSTELSIWYIGHAVQKLGVPDWITSSVDMFFRLAGVAFHPLDQDRLYIFYQPYTKVVVKGDTKEKLISNLYVQEYLKSTPQRTWFQESLFTGSPHYWPTPSKYHIEATQCEGLVSITETAKHAEEWNIDAHQQPPLCNHDTPDTKPRWHFASFNIFTGEFQTHISHMRKFSVSSVELDDSCNDFYPLIWRDQVIITQKDERGMNHLIPLNNCGTHRRSVPVNLEQTIRSSLDFGWQVVGAAFIYSDLCDMIDSMRKRRNERRGRVWGDDNFLVMNDDVGYMVWSFDETVNLPKHPTDEV